jgi:hypothetical protein
MVVAGAAMMARPVVAGPVAMAVGVVAMVVVMPGNADPAVSTAVEPGPGAAAAGKRARDAGAERAQRSHARENAGAESSPVAPPRHLQG